MNTEGMLAVDGRTMLSDLFKTHPTAWPVSSDLCAEGREQGGFCFSVGFVFSRMRFLLHMRKLIAFQGTLNFNLMNFRKLYCLCEPHLIILQIFNHLISTEESIFQAYLSDG